MGRMERGFRLAGASWQVLKHDRELMWLPVVSFIAVMIAAASFAGVGWGLGFPSEQGAETIHYVLLGLFYLVTYGISIFFNAAVVAAAMIRLEGGDPTVADGLRAAWERRGKILGWAAVAATVGMILRSLEQRAGFVGRIVIAIIGVAWSAVTFFVVPILLFEELRVMDSIKRSGTLFKQRWGEQFVGNASIGIAVFVLAIPVLLVAGLLAAVAIPLGIITAVIGLGVLGAASAAMSGIFNAALYRYATTGAPSGPFTAEDLAGSFRPKKSR